MDYWQDCTGLRALETELLDTSIVITILGIATRGDTAITDLSFSGKTLILANIVHSQRIIMMKLSLVQKTFITTIYSVGITVKKYDNNSAICAGGVKTIQDINPSVDLSNYYNKSQTYSQTETDQKLNLKLNISDQIDAYTMTQDDALLLLKADKTQLIDAYSKTEADNLQNNKADSGVSYIKGEDDALFSLKADKAQLIDAYTKDEANSLFNNQVNQQTTYIKIGTDQLIS
ncbi:MAG: hypothetical protein EZS28_009686 [Streblomastix strix]|uniref:Uncharacterized protein n=1 Tax=Streblomastix strix TaxID=222440 RepID=A0A5J4WJ81_9EUKA|nr:MAG: hypothetical protein EZS28_009686 [Streblomastix strix]